MFTYHESDCISLEAFPIKWRWLEENHTPLPEADLQTIHPLSEAKAREAYAYSSNFQGENYRTRYQEIDEYHVEGRNHEPYYKNAREWLLSHLGNDSGIIFISWIEPWAMAVELRTFLTYWESFLYPVEDVVIWPAHEQWALLFDYKQRFYFARRKDGGAR